MTIKALYPTVRPTLNLDFAKTKVLDPRVTFTRASTATFVGSNGLIQTAASGAARFDHNPSTGESLGLLVEEARTNEMSQSIIRPDNAGIYSRWTESDGASIVPDAGLAPDGTFTAALVTFPQSTSVPRVSRQTTTASGVRSVSVWLKAASGTIQVRVGNGNDFGATQTIGTQWTRVTYVVAAGSSNFAGIYCPSPQVFTEFYAWGFQQEPGSFSTSYIPTVASTVTRAADVASMTGTNFSSWYNQSEGTLFASYIKTTTNTGGVFKTSNGTFDQRIDIMYRSNSANVNEAIVGGTSSARYDYTVNLSTKAKQIFAYKLNNFNAAYNGTVFTADTSGSVPTVTQALIGSNDGPSEWLNAPIARLTYYPVRLPDAQLPALTL
jgi:hypothetical protein